MPTTSNAHRLAAIAFAAAATLCSSLYAETNAAQVALGARVSATAGQGARLDPKTGPNALIDNNVHSRMVVSGAPYTVTIELFRPLPIERIALSASDYASEVLAKDLEITLDDGTVIKHTLDATRPTRRNQPAWQSVPVGGKTSQRVKITVLSLYEPADPKVNWGGIGEIAVYTNQDLGKTFELNHDPKAPVSNNIPPLRADESPVQVKLPPRAKPNVWPRTMMLAEEIAELKPRIQADPKARAAYNVLIAKAEDALKGDIKFPDPKGPLSQLKSRNDETMKAHSALSAAVGNLGRAYAFSGEKKYAQRAADILKGYAKIYHEYPEHKGVNGSDTGKISAQRLSEAMWLIPQLIGYDLIHDSGVLSAEDHKLIETGLIRPCVEFIWRKTPAAIAAERSQQNPNWRTATPPAKRAVQGNWLNFYNTATMLAGAVLQDQDYIDVAAANFRQLLRNGIGDDGMWGEGAIGYQYFAMAAMVPGFETAARNGYDLYSFDDNRFKLLFDSPQFYAYPDGSMPGINDSGRVRGSFQMMVCDYAYLRYGDDRYANVINATNRQLHFSEGIYAPTLVFGQLPEPGTTKYPSAVFTGLGYAIVRTDTTYALIDYGGHGGTHGHYDKLNLILFANGDEMGGEPRFHRYEDPLHAQWTVQTIAHNTMTLDQHSQSPCTGKLLCYEASQPVKIQRAEAVGAYAGAILDRTVVMTDDAIYDLYSARSNFDRTFDRTLRFQGKLDQYQGSDKAAPLGDRAGYQHILKAGQSPANDGWTGVWSTKGGPFAVTVAGGREQDIILGTDRDNAHLAILRQKGPRADVGVVYRPGQAAGAPAKLLDTGSPNLVAMQVENADQSITTIYVAHKPGPWKAGNIESDARVLYVHRTGDTVQEALFTGGTFAKLPGGELKLDAYGNAAARQDGGTLKQTFSWTAPAAESAKAQK